MIRRKRYRDTDARGEGDLHCVWFMKGKVREERIRAGALRRRGGEGERSYPPRILCHVTVSTMCISLREKKVMVLALCLLGLWTLQRGHQGVEGVLLS